MTFNTYALASTCLVLTCLTFCNSIQLSSMKCYYGERGSLTALCINANPTFFRLTPYRFDHLDETLKCVNCTLTTITQGNFDLAGNVIKTLDISNSSIDSIKEKAFVGLLFLEKLILSDNRISELQPGCFRGVRKIRYITMENALTLTTLENDVFQELSQLEELDLKRNHLTRLEERAFHGLMYLKILDLSYNKLTKIADSLKYLKNLQVLTLENNHIARITGTEFYQLNALLEINLSNNLIGNINMELHPSNNLRVLDLSNNHLGNSGISNSTFTHMSKLETLNLGLNWFKTIPPKYFQGLFNLHVLDLNRNEIYKFETGAFTGLPMLKLLNVSHNSINCSAITGRLSLNDLHSLDLSHNSLAHFDYVGFIQRAPKISFINLESNMLPCKEIRQLQAYSFRDSIHILLDGLRNTIDCSKIPMPSPQELVASLDKEIARVQERSSAPEVTMVILICVVFILIGVLFGVQFLVINRKVYANLRI